MQSNFVFLADKHTKSRVRCLFAQEISHHTFLILILLEISICVRLAMRVVEIQGQ